MKSEIEVKDCNLGHRVRPQLFGEEQNRIISSTSSGFLKFYTFNFEKKTVSEFIHDERIVPNDWFYGGKYSITYCGSLVQMNPPESFPGAHPKMFFLAVFGDNRIKVINLGQNNQMKGLGVDGVLVTLRSDSEVAVWVGFSNKKGGIVLTYEFNYKTLEIKEFEWNLEVKYQGLSVQKMQFVDCRLYYATDCGKIMSLGLEK